jgi:hypothetical protein
MLISIGFALPLNYACVEINKTGLSNLVFSLHESTREGKPFTTVIFKDNGYNQAKFICDRLGYDVPTVDDWIGE